MTERSYFQLFTRDDQEAFAYAAGETIFEAGDAGDCSFVFRRGEVSLHSNDQDLETVTAGGILGEIALVNALILLRSAYGVGWRTSTRSESDAKSATFHVRNGT